MKIKHVKAEIHAGDETFTISVQGWKSFAPVKPYEPMAMNGADWLRNMLNSMKFINVDGGIILATDCIDFVKIIEEPEVEVADD